MARKSGRSPVSRLAMDHHTPRSGLRSQPQPQKQTREIEKTIGRVMYKFNNQEWINSVVAWWTDRSTCLHRGGHRPATGRPQHGRSSPFSHPKRAQCCSIGDDISPMGSKNGHAGVEVNSAVSGSSTGAATITAIRPSVRPSTPQAGSASIISNSSSCDAGTIRTVVLPPSSAGAIGLGLTNAVGR